MTSTAVEYVPQNPLFAHEVEVRGLGDRHPPEDLRIALLEAVPRLRGGFNPTRWRSIGEWCLASAIVGPSVSQAVWGEKQYRAWDDIPSLYQDALLFFADTLVGAYGVYHDPDYRFLNLDLPDYKTVVPARLLDWLSIHGEESSVDSLCEELYQIGEYATHHAGGV